MPQKGLPTVTAIIVAAGASRRMGFDKLSYCLPRMGARYWRQAVPCLPPTRQVDELVLVAGRQPPPVRGYRRGLP